MANAQIAAHGVVCNPNTSEFETLPIKSLIRAAEIFRSIGRQLVDEMERPVNVSGHASDYFDAAATELALRSDRAYEALERRRPMNKDEADSKYRALVEWYASTGEHPEKVLSTVQMLITTSNTVQ